MYNNKMNLNNISLYQEGGPMEQNIVDPQISGIINDIQARLQVGESPQEVVVYMLQQGYPPEFVSSAFEKIGYDPAAMVDLMQSIQMPQAQPQQQMLPRTQSKQMEDVEQTFQYGGSKKPKYIRLNLDSDIYKPMYLPLTPEKGNVFGAAEFLGDAVDSMFSNEIVDGVKKGSFRDLKTKKSRWDETKPEQYDYKVTLDPRDKNKYIPTKKDLYNKTLRTEDQFMKDLRENSRVNFNPQTGMYETLISDSKINTDLYGRNKPQADKFINSNPNLQSFFERFDPETLDLLSKTEYYPKGSSLGISPSGEAKSYRTEDNPFYYETMMGENTLQSNQQNPFDNLFKMQWGGSGVASTQDSLNVYNNAVQLKNFYDRLKPYYGPVNTFPIYQSSDQFFKGYSDASKEHLKSSDVTQANKNKIRQNTNPNLTYVSDYVTGAIDPNAPLAVVDRRIKPQSEISYRPKNTINNLFQKYNISPSANPISYATGYNYDKYALDKIIKDFKIPANELYKAYNEQIKVQKNTPGFNTLIPYYEPIAVKPYNMLTDAERKIRDKKYPLKNKPATVTPKPAKTNPVRTETPVVIPDVAAIPEQVVLPDPVQGGGITMWVNPGTRKIEYLYGTPGNMQSLSASEFEQFKQTPEYTRYKDYTGENRYANLRHMLTVPQAGYLNNRQINQQNNINLQEQPVNINKELTKRRFGGYIAQDGMETNDIMLDEVVINSPINDPKINKNLNFNNWYQRQMQRPAVQNFGNVSKFAVAGANLANEMFTQGRYNQYDNNLRNMTMADNVFQTRFNPVNSRGTWDVNTGLAEPDNLYPYLNQSQYGGEIEVDTDTLTKLIAAGADIQIL